MNENKIHSGKGAEAVNFVKISIEKRDQKVYARYGLKAPKRAE